MTLVCSQALCLVSSVKIESFIQGSKIAEAMEEPSIILQYSASFWDIEAATSRCVKLSFSICFPRCDWMHSNTKRVSPIVGCDDAERSFVAFSNGSRSKCVSYIV